MFLASRIERLFVVLASSALTIHAFDFLVVTARNYL